MKSPFKMYEEEFCNNCDDYNGCIGLIDNLTMTLQDENENKDMGKFLQTMSGMTFTTRFRLLLDCKDMREFLSDFFGK